MNPNETINEVIRELSSVLLELAAPTPAGRERSARVLDRCCEDLAEAAEQIRNPKGA
jgi:hypothetical protein